MDRAHRTPRRSRFWGWVTVVVTITIAAIYLMVAKPWSTYDGRKPFIPKSRSSHSTGVVGHRGPQALPGAPVRRVHGQS